MNLRNISPWCALAVVGATFVACSKSADQPAANATSVANEKVAIAGHSHDGWWCAEHGVPEEECARCDIKLVANFKAKGDWCEEHNRPDSQCFVCHPEKEAVFAERYEAKYGQQPPKMTAESEEAHGDHEHHDHS
jgi:hypothetical protein